MKNGIRWADITQIFDLAMATVPKVASVFGFILLAMLLKKVIPRWKDLSVEAMAVVIIAFALVLK